MQVPDILYLLTVQGLGYFTGFGGQNDVLWRIQCPIYRPPLERLLLPARGFPGLPGDT